MRTGTRCGAACCRPCHTPNCAPGSLQLKHCALYCPRFPDTFWSFSDPHPHFRAEEACMLSKLAFGERRLAKDTAGLSDIMEPVVRLACDSSMAVRSTIIDAAADWAQGR